MRLVTCSGPDCDRPAKTDGLCNAHYEQRRRTGDLWSIKERARRLTETEMDLALLLITRGASSDEAAATFQIGGPAPGRALKRQLKAFSSAAFRDAVSARWVTEHGTKSRYARGCRCGDCRRSQSDQWRLRNGVSVEGVPKPHSGMDQSKEYNRYFARSQQSRTMAVASRRGYQWTGVELEIVNRNDLTARQVAEMLGRTYYAVHTQRSRLKADPRKRQAAGV